MGPRTFQGNRSVGVFIPFGRSKVWYFFRVPLLHPRPLDLQGHGDWLPSEGALVKNIRKKTRVLVWENWRNLWLTSNPFPVLDHQNYMKTIEIIPYLQCMVCICAYICLIICIILIHVSSITILMYEYHIPYMDGLLSYESLLTDIVTWASPEGSLTNHWLDIRIYM